MLNIAKLNLLIILSITPSFFVTPLHADDDDTRLATSLDEGFSDELVGIGKGTVLGSIFGWLSDAGSKVVSAALKYADVKSFVEKYGPSNLRVLAEILEGSHATLSLETLTMLATTAYRFLLEASTKWGTGFTGADVPTFEEELQQYADSTAKAFVSRLVSGGYIKLDRVAAAEARLAALLRSMAERLGGMGEVEKGKNPEPPTPKPMKVEPSPSRAM